jgi:hypothetical protein
VLKENIKLVEEEHKKIKEETRKKLAEPKKSLSSISAIETAMEKLDERIA